MTSEYEPFDISEYLDSEERIAGVLSAAAEDEDPNVLLGALAHAAKARGMMEVARAAGLSRESLYKALKPGAHPRFETVHAVLRALGVTLAVSPQALERFGPGVRTVALGKGKVVRGMVSPELAQKTMKRSYRVWVGEEQQPEPEKKRGQGRTPKKSREAHRP